MALPQLDSLYLFGIMEGWNDGKMDYRKLEEWFIDKIFHTMRFINDLDSLWLFGILEKWNNGIMGYGKLEKWFIGKILFAKKFLNDKFIIKIIIPMFQYSIIPGMLKMRKHLNNLYISMSCRIYET